MNSLGVGEGGGAHETILVTVGYILIFHGWWFIMGLSQFYENLHIAHKVDHGALVRRYKKPIVYLYPWNAINLFCGHRDLKEMDDPEKNDKTEPGKST